jgi:hypothetical protein
VIDQPCERRARGVRAWGGRTPCGGGGHDAARRALCRAVWVRRGPRKATRSRAHLVGPTGSGACRVLSGVYVVNDKIRNRCWCDRPPCSCVVCLFVRVACGFTL